MRVRSCFHPKAVKQKDGSIVFVACGKCKACQNTRALTWQKRLELEVSGFKHLYFVTLTYDDDHLHVILPNYNRSFLIGHDLDIAIPFDSVSEGSFIFDHKEVTNFEYLNSRPFFPVLNKRDVSSFMKRLRSMIHYNITKFNIQENEKIRFFACGEYGETTFRPHYHILLWFNSEFINSHIFEYISSCWQSGSNTTKAADPHVAQYVTKYLNRSGCLPEVYLSEQIRPFTICSKRPFISYDSFDKKEIQRLFFSSAVEFSVFDYSKRKPCYVRLWRSFESRLFPKIKGYNNLTYLERVGLYGITNEYVSRNATEFVQQITSRIDSVYPYRPYISVREVLEREGYFEKSINGTYDCLVRLYYISREFCKRCHLYGISVSCGVSIIETHYQNLQLYNLKNQFEYEDLVLKENRLHLKDLIFLDPSLIDRILHRNEFVLSVSYNRLFENLGFSDHGCYPFYTVLDDVRKYIESRTLDNIPEYLSLPYSLHFDQIS